ncbi:MAG: hypothetical protein JNK26_03245 [Candidatus Doudnabacteria bacterium]|nr:hypothetical protein [Candidatus Doudnabacteria bacterium]
MFSELYDQTLPIPDSYKALQAIDFPDRQKVIRLSDHLVKELARIIPYEILHSETVNLELELQARANKNGYKWMGCGGFENSTVHRDNNYHHALEHTIIGVIENNLSPFNAGGQGITETEIINDQTGRPVPPLTELPEDFSIRRTVYLLLSRSIPKRLHQYYVDQVIRKMKENFTLYGELRLNEIVLD